MVKRGGDVTEYQMVTSVVKNDNRPSQGEDVGHSITRNTLVSVVKACI